MVKIKNNSTGNALRVSDIISIVFGLGMVIFLGNLGSNLSYASGINSTDTVNSTTQPNLDLNSNISALAYDLADYHYNLAKTELAKGNATGAAFHANLAMMSLDEISDMVKGKLNQENKDTLSNSDPGNCIISKDGTAMCLP
jgi:hypothetical protein